MGLPELKAVSLAARLGSLSRTAEALNITQPALSRRIAEAEKSVGVPLFDRLPRGVRPTDACVAFLQHAEIALTSIDEGCEAALAANVMRENKISLAFIEVLCDDLLLDACERTALQFPGVSLDFHSCVWSADVSTRVMSGAAKLGLRFRRDPRPQLESIWIADDPIAVACGASHRLAKAGRATMEQLEECQFIGGPAAVDRTFNTYQDGILSGGFQDWKTMDVHTVHARTTLMKAGLGLGLVRRSCIQRELKEGSLVELETPLLASMPVFLSWRRGAFLNEVTQFLADELRHVYARQDR